MHSLNNTGNEFINGEIETHKIVIQPYVLFEHKFIALITNGKNVFVSD